MSATSPMRVRVATGGRLSVERLGSGGISLATMPAGGGAESPVAVTGSLINQFWTDSVTMALAERQADGVHLSQVDVRTGARRNLYVMPDSTITDCSPLVDGGWAWLPADGKSVMVVRPGQPARRVPLPDWYLVGINMTASRDGRLV